MTPWINAIGIATVLTALFALRFRTWRQPKMLAVYFTFFFATEFAVGQWVLPPQAFGPEVGWVCMVISALTAAAIYGIDRYERSTGQQH